MKEIWNWIVKNFSNLFTIIGIVLTVYFSIFYVPEYIKENENEKVKNINSDLIESVQEIIYNEYELTQEQIDALIKGKEIKHKVEYPYTADDLLIQTQEAFMANKFIPLNNRIEVANKIDSLRNTIKPDEASVRETSAKSRFENSEIIATILSVLTGILATALGSFSFFKKLKKERKIEISEKIDEQSDTIRDSVTHALQFEQMIKVILDKNEISYHRSTAIDFVIRLNKDKRICIDVKYLTKSNTPPAEYYHRVFTHFEVMNALGVLVFNKEINKLFPDSIENKYDTLMYEIIGSDDSEQIEKSLLKIINNYRQQLSSNEER